MSNIIDSTTSRVPEHFKEFEILERSGTRIGIIGLVEQYVKLSIFSARDIIGTMSYLFLENGFLILPHGLQNLFTSQ